MNAQTQQLIKVDEFTGIIQTAPQMLETNQTSVARCNDAGKTLLDTIEANGEINSDELDAQVSNFIDKAKVTVKKMNERRSPLTQLLTKIAKEFTTLENEINITNKNSIPAQLQAHRDKYAAKKLAEIKRREEEERKKQLVENEKTEYRNSLINELNRFTNFYFEQKGVELSELFNTITIDNYAINSQLINDFSTTYNASEHLKQFKDAFYCVHLSQEQINEVKKAVVPGVITQSQKRFAENIQSMKDDLIIRLPSKLNELKKIEELKKQDANAAARALEAQKQREAEDKARQEAERKKREAEEKARQEAEAAQAALLASFNATAEAIPTNIPDAKVTKKIKIHNVKGFLEIYQMWFLGDGASMSIEDLEKIHKRMITFCERKANRDGEFISSAFIEYVDDVKAK